MLILTEGSLYLNELNEYEWWSNWADHLKKGNVYKLMSKLFKEPLFNRIGFFSGMNETGQLHDFISEGISFFVPIAEGYEAVERHLLRAGYVMTDRLDVYNFKNSHGEKEDGVKILEKDDIEKWASVYIRSFGEEANLNPHIIDSLEKALGRGKTFLIAKAEGPVLAGVAAVYENEYSAGIYCVGVLPEYRHRKIGASLVNFAAGLTGKPVFLQAFSSAALDKFYSKIGFKLVYSKEVLAKPDIAGPEHCLSGFYVDRNAMPGMYKLNQVFTGLDKRMAASQILETEEMKNIRVIIEDGFGYMYVLDGKIHVNRKYLKTADIRYLYLDILHELVHVSQHKRGMDLYDRRYSYFKRPTEIEAYRTTISEAHKIGMKTAEIIEYLKVEWVNEDEFAEFLIDMKINVTGNLA